jgi:GTPase SAR1 family protein
MIENNFRKWLNEAVEKNKNFYVLVGPPAAGKTSWIKDFIEDQGDTFAVISRDQIIEDQIFPKYRLSNNELYTLAPPENSEEGKTVNGMERFGKVIKDKKGRKAFERILRANAEVEETLKKEIKNILATEPDNIIIDAINGTDKERSVALNIVKEKPNYKKIAVYFEFMPYQEEIKVRAAKRAELFKKEMGKNFDRTIPDKSYDAIFKRITLPHVSEGFDEIYAYDSFKKVKKDTMDTITAEKLTLEFRKFLNDEQLEKEVLEEARLSRVWRSKAKQRARRHERPYDKSDLKWAHDQQKKWHKNNPELEEFYLKEIEAATEAAKSTKNYLSKIREIRKQKMEEKAKFKKPKGKLSKKTLPSPYDGEGKETKNFPYKKARTGGVAKVYRKRIKRIGGMGVAPGEAFGPLEEAPQTQNQPQTVGQLKQALLQIEKSKGLDWARNTGTAIGKDAAIDAAITTTSIAGGLPGIAVAAGLKISWEILKRFMSQPDNSRLKNIFGDIDVSDKYTNTLKEKILDDFAKSMAEKIEKMPDNYPITAAGDMNKNLQRFLEKQPYEIIVRLMK